MIKRIAIIEAKEPCSPVVSKYGTYGTIFQNFIESISKSIPGNNTFEYSVYNLSKDHLPSEEDMQNLDIILISGGKQSVTDFTPDIVRVVQFVQENYKKHPGISWIGICLGHQIIANAFGANVQKNQKQWELANGTLELTKLGKAVFDTNEKTILINQMHQDICEIPNNMKLLAFNDHTFNQAMLNDRMISVQGHPEFTKDMVQMILNYRLKSKAIDTDLVQKAYQNNNDIEESSKKIMIQLLRFCVDKEWREGILNL